MEGAGLEENNSWVQHALLISPSGSELLQGEAFPSVSSAVSVLSASLTATRQLLEQSLCHCGPAGRLKLDLLMSDRNVNIIVVDPRV